MGSALFNHPSIEVGEVRTKPTLRQTVWVIGANLECRRYIRLYRHLNQKSIFCKPAKKQKPNKDYLIKKEVSKKAGK
jgi:hypothetical protein